MSALCGILRFDGEAVARRDLERCLATMPHRQPDGRRLWCDETIGFGHGLLRVTHEDAFEVQPLNDPQAPITLVADLRLDNREELAAALAIDATRLTTMPDSALLLAAYRHWGEDCSRHLLGDFVFAIWDGRTRRLVLGRDHMGQCHLFWHRGPDFFAFASEIKALWTLPDVPRVLGDARIGKLLMMDLGIAPGQTLYDGIASLPGGTTMTVTAGGETESRLYWEPQADPAHLGRDEAYYVEAYRRVLAEAVACRVRRAARPPGLIFSGGYDSSAIAGLAGPVLTAQGRKLVAVASTMPADYTGTIRHARHWVELCARHMPHLALDQVTREGLDPLQDFERHCRALDGPAGSYHFVHDAINRRLAARGVRLVMDGHGGDYTLNPRGQMALVRFLKTGRWLRFARELPSYLHRSGYTPWATIRSEIIKPLLPVPLLRLVERLRRGKAPPWGAQPVAPEFARRLIAAGEIDLDSLHAAPRRGAMRDRFITTLQRVRCSPSSGGAIAAAQHGMALTRPFHDRRVVELALAIPEDLYVKHGRNRYLACRALHDVYPPEFQTRWRLNDDQVPDFQAMTARIGPQLQAELDRMAASPNLSRYVDFKRIGRLLAARGPEDHNSGWEQETHMALRGLLLARYVEWFRRDNR